MGGGGREKKREEGEKGLEGGREISNEGRDSSSRTKNGSLEVGKIQPNPDLKMGLLNGP